MRQLITTAVIIAVLAVTAGALVTFAIVRSGTGHGEHESHAAHQHEAGTEHENGHAHSETGTDGQQEAVDLSGKVVDGVRVIEVTARKFVFDPAQIVVDEGEKVRLEVTSQDVTHGIGIEAYGIDRKLEPGRTETIEFLDDTPGRHHFHCTVYCGSGHQDMHGELIIRSAKE